MILIGISLNTACISVKKNSAVQLQLNKSNCNQQNEYYYTVNDLPQALYKLQLDSLLVQNFSFSSLNIAHAIGLLDYLKQYVEEHHQQKNNPSIERRLKLIELHQTINRKIDFASLEISAVSSEIDCEEERAAQIAAYMEGKENKRESHLTVGSIVVGALGAITTGVLLSDHSEDNAADIVGISAGLMEATLGLLILKNKMQIEFYHPRNSLRDIWEGKEVSNLFPMSIWYYLNYYDPNKPDKNSLRYQIIESWMNFKQIKGSVSKKEKAAREIYFSNGGKYDVEQLKNRAHMYDQLEAVVKLMKQDLKNLMYEIEKI